MGGFSILTNVASLQAQNYLSTNQAFQNQTIQEVTSGLRIVNSGDDAAGLAIANGYQADEAVLTQGIQNANNGVSQLQIMDGGMSNITQLLDRASTLATESASGTFDGNRATLNAEYQSVLQEIDRQAQSIGLNQGGTYAKSLSVFIGGGQGTTSAAALANGTVSVDLGTATVDTQSLGLKGFTAGYQVAPGTEDSGLYDLSSGTATSVSNILAANGSPTTTSFVLSGPGFGAGAGVNSPVTITVNLANVGDPTSLVNAINAGIDSAVAGGQANDQALGAANIQASIHTGADGHQQLVFTSPDSAFNVTAGDATANALLGNMTGNTGGSATGITSDVGAAVNTASANFVAGGTQQSSAIGFTTMVAGDSQTLSFTVNDASGNPQTDAITLTDANTSAQAVAAINSALQATDNPALQGIVASVDGAGGTITFSSNSPSPFSVAIGQDVNGGAAGTANTDGFANPNTTVTSAVVGTGATSSIATEAGASAAVSALTNAVGILGNAQAAVGRGENQFNYAINLAQSELTNTTAAESGIRDANLAAEAANLTKAQILLQAGVAALAQANAAPQNILALLKS